MLAITECFGCAHIKLAFECLTNLPLKNWQVLELAADSKRYGTCTAWLAAPHRPRLAPALASLALPNVPEREAFASCRDPSNKQVQRIGASMIIRSHALNAGPILCWVWVTYCCPNACSVKMIYFTVRYWLTWMGCCMWVEGWRQKLFSLVIKMDTFTVAWHNKKQHLVKSISGLNVAHSGCAAGERAGNILRWHHASRLWGRGTTKGFRCHFRGFQGASQSLVAVQKKIQVGSEEFNERQVQEISDRLCSRSMWMLKWNEIIVSIIFNNIEVEHCCGNLPPQSHATSERFGAQCFNDVAAGLPWISSMSGAGGIHEGLLKLIPQVVFWADLAPKKYNTCNVSTGPIPECPGWIQFLGHPSLYVFGSLAENTQQNQQLLPSQV